MRKPSKSPLRAIDSELEAVTVRFFQKDLDKLRAEAKRTQIPWHQTLRHLVHDALRGRRVIS